MDNDELNTQLKEINEKLLLLTSTLPIKISDALIKKLDEIRDPSTHETTEDTLWRLIRFYDFYMGYFDAMRDPKHVRISENEDMYSILIDLKSPYCGHIIELNEIDFKELEELKSKVMELKTENVKLKMRVAELEDVN